LDLNELIKSCVKKELKAQEELYHIYKKKLFPICLKYCRSYTEAEDHLHDTFIEIFEQIKKYKNKGSFEGWMKRITINKAIDKYKKQKDFELADYRLAEITEEVYLDNSQSLPTEELIQLIQELPNQYRFVFNMYELDGYSHKEIAKIIGITESTSKSNLHRAKVHLKKRILAYQKNKRN